MGSKSISNNVFSLPLADNRDKMEQTKAVKAKKAVSAFKGWNIEYKSQERIIVENTYIKAYIEKEIKKSRPLGGNQMKDAKWNPGDIQERGKTESH